MDEVAYYRAKIREMEQSDSWRVTAPLRDAKSATERFGVSPGSPGESCERRERAGDSRHSRTQRRRYLKEVLSAIRSQSLHQDVEILLVDSGSTDGSVDVAKSFGAVLHEIPGPSSRTVTRATSSCDLRRATTSPS